MKNKTFCFGFEFKAISERTDEAKNETYHVIEGILSTDSLDQGEDIVETKAILDSVSSFGLPKFLHQHDGFGGMPLGTVVALNEIDGGGILIRTEVIKGIQSNDDIVAKAAHGEYGGLSIGYKPLDVEFKGSVRIIKELRLREASLVVFPMNEQAVLTSVKSIENMKTLKEIELDMREHGYSKKESETVISQIKALSLGDQENKGLGDQDKKDKEKIELEKKAAEKEKENRECIEMFSKFFDEAEIITKEMKEV